MKKPAVKPAPYTDKEILDMNERFQIAPQQPPSVKPVLRMAVVTRSINGAVEDTKDPWVADVKRNVGRLINTLAGLLCQGEAELKELEKEYGPMGSGPLPRVIERDGIMTNISRFITDRLMAAFSENDAEAFHQIGRLMKRRKSGGDVLTFEVKTRKMGRGSKAWEFDNIFSRVWADAVERLTITVPVKSKQHPELTELNPKGSTAKVVSRERIKFSDLKKNAERMLKKVRKDKAAKCPDDTLTKWLKKEGAWRFVWPDHQKKYQ